MAEGRESSRSLRSGWRWCLRSPAAAALPVSPTVAPERARRADTPAAPADTRGPGRPARAGRRASLEMARPAVAAGGTTAGGGGGAGRAGAGGGADRAGAGGGQVGGGGDGGSAVDGGSPDGATANVAAPRLIAPLSTATVTSRRPTLHWLLAAGSDGAHVRVCRDRACATPVASFDATGSTGAPANDLPTGRAVLARLRPQRRHHRTGLDARLAVHRRDAQRRDRHFLGNDAGRERRRLPRRHRGGQRRHRQQQRADAGRAYVYMGSASGLTTPAVTLVGPDTASASSGLGRRARATSTATATPTSSSGLTGLAASAAALLYLGGPNGLESTVATAAVGPLPAS